MKIQNNMAMALSAARKSIQNSELASILGLAVQVQGIRHNSNLSEGEKKAQIRLIAAQAQAIDQSKKDKSRKELMASAVDQSATADQSKQSSMSESAAASKKDATSTNGASTSSANRPGESVQKAPDANANQGTPSTPTLGQIVDTHA